MAKAGTAKRAKAAGREKSELRSGETAAADLDLRQLDREALVRLRNDVDLALQSYEKRKRADALREMEAVAERHGLKLKDVVQSAATRSVKPPRFRHPDDPALTWTGRGRQPGWYKEAIDAGASPEDLKIA